jgi:hypothetical protein
MVKRRSARKNRPVAREIIIIIITPSTFYVFGA